MIVARSNLTKAQVGAEQTKAEYDRAQVLAASGVGTQQALDLAKANYESARASVSAAAAAVTQASAQVEQKAAAVRVAQTNLDYTVIRSPIDGVVVARNVDIGQTVAASLQAPTIFTIAQDLTKMQVYAKVDESDVGRIRVGQPASFKVDAYPRDQFTGTVSQIRMNPTTLQNVVTYDAIVELDQLRPQALPGDDGLRDAAGGDRAGRGQGAQRGPQVQAAAAAGEGARALRQVRHRGRRGRRRRRGPAAAVGARRSGRPELAVVWRLGPDGSPEPVQVALGITDHTYTELVRVLAGTVAPGDELVTSVLSGKSQPPGAGIRR